MDLKQALRTLTGTADDISGTLYRSGIRGVQWSACRCPIANYLRQCGMVDPQVGLTEATVGVAVGLGMEQEFLPSPIREFIMSFDDGRYPYLLEAT